MRADPLLSGAPGLVWGTKAQLLEPTVHKWGPVQRIRDDFSEEVEPGTVLP